jgi:hypothetical protein
MTEGARIQRARRWAKRLGYRITKGRSQLVHVDDHGEWMVLGLASNCVVAGHRYDCSLDDVEEFFRETEAAVLKARAA